MFRFKSLYAETYDTTPIYAEDCHIWLVYYEGFHIWRNHVGQLNGLCF